MTDIDKALDVARRCDEANALGTAVPLRKSNLSEPAPRGDGLHHKYDVVKRSTGETVTDCFVLRPATDPAARVALMAYANATPHPQLRDELRQWVADAWMEATK